MHQCQRAETLCQPATLSRLHAAQASCRKHRGILAAPAGRLTPQWARTAAADDAAPADAVQAPPQEQGAARGPSQPPSLGSWFRSARAAAARAFYTLPNKTAVPGKVGPPLAISRQALQSHQLSASSRESSERNRKLAAQFEEVRKQIEQSTEDLERKMEKWRAAHRARPAPAPAPAPRPARAPAQRPAPLVWEPAPAEAAPAAVRARQQAAEASAAAAMAWVTTAAAREAAAEAAAERASGLPAALHTAGAEEWEWAASAWQAAYAALEAARQACPDAPAVQEAEAAVEAAAALRAARQGWRGGVDGGSSV